MKKIPKGCIYLIRNLVNGKGYVGQHKNVETVEKVRWREHIAVALNTKAKTYIHRAIRKYGVENFSAEVIWRGPAEQLNAKETHYIKKLCTFANDPLGGGYNLTKGGRSGGPGGLSKQSRANISRAGKRRFKDPAQRQRQKDDQVRRWADEDAHTAASIAHKRSYELDPTLCKRLGEAGRRRYESPIERQKTSATTKTLWEDSSYREKVSINHCASYKRPGVHERVVEGQIRRYKDPAEREAASKRSTHMWKNPVIRAKICKSLNQPEVKAVIAAKASAAGKKRYMDPEEHVKTSNRSKAGWARRRAAGLHNKNYKGGPAK